MAYRDPVRPINVELRANLEMVSTTLYPLPGATGRRQETQADPRLTGLKDQTLPGDEVTYYEHIATVRDKKSGQFFVAFRETMDAFLARQRDTGKFPEWLMKSPEKQAERQIHIYRVTRHPKTVPILRSHEDWTEHIADVSTFDTVAFLLNRHHVIDDAVYASMR